MEKLIYALEWDQPSRPEELAAIARREGASQVRINIRDEAVAGGAGLIQSRSASLPDCVIQLWLPSSNIRFRAALDKALGEISNSLTGWLVCESTILEKTAPSPAGHRGDGFAQLAFLTLPETLSWREWRHIWRDSHTQIAIDTQSNFEYRQNLIVEELFENAGDAPAKFVAIVEECFPKEALTDPLTFFDAAGDKDKFQRNLDAMMASCARFITPGTIDVFPSSQYDFAG